MLSVFRNMFRIRDLRNKIFFTMVIFAVYRLGAAIPVPGVDLDAVKQFADEAASAGIVGLLNLFSGGALEVFSVFSLGIMPYITSSIIMQLLAVVIPKLQRLQDEGESGRKVVTQWTRYGTVILALLQSTGLTFLFHRGVLTGGIDLIPNYTPGRVLVIVLTLTAGTAFIMWLGELITQRGVGNGMSLIIFVSIVSQIPAQFSVMRTSTTLPRFLAVCVMFLVLTAGIIFVDQGQRRIPIQFSKRVRGRRVLGGQSTYIPLKVNTAGVIPIIFASSVLYFPALISTSIPAEGIFGPIRRFIDTNLVSGATWGYVIVFGLLIIFFTYFYTAIQFDPERQSDMIQRQGGFIPGIRPGSATTRYLEHILSRITLPGSLFLAGVAVLPSIVAIIWNISLGFSGISILIVVGVALETMKQIESQLMMRNYEGFLT
ncbi:preprotein translocase subunit SecY [bacterium]|nr:preprotein translocase subunit SecY [bacterium]